MKASVNLIITDLSESELHGLLRALQGATPSATVTFGTAVTAAGVVEASATTDAAPCAGAPEEAPAPSDTAPAAPPKPRGRPRKTPEAEAPTAAPAEAAEGTFVPTPAPAAPAADAPKVTENAVKQAIGAAIKARGIDFVRKVVGSFKNASGAQATKLTDLQAADYAAVVAALEAA